MLISCKENPYPQEGEITKNTPPPLEINKPILSLDIESHYYLQEGVWASIPFDAFVPEPGEPIVRFENLPEGAEYVEEDKLIKWKPSFEDGDSTSGNGHKVHDFTIWLSSTEDEFQAVSKKVSLIVQDVSRGISIKTSKTEFSLKEGETLQHYIQIEDYDNPVGPFKVLATGIQGLNITAVSDTEFQLTFSPQIGFAKLFANSRCYSGSGYTDCAKMAVTLMAYSDENKIVMQDVTITVVKAPVITSSQQGQQSQSQTDENGEM